LAVPVTLIAQGTLALPKPFDAVIVNCFAPAICQGIANVALPEPICE
jgi:hypothetical protein